MIQLYHCLCILMDYVASFRIYKKDAKNNQRTKQSRVEEKYHLANKCQELMNCVSFSLHLSQKLLTD